MRFLILTQYFPPEVGAAQVRLYSVARELMRRGHEVRVVTAMPNYPLGAVHPAYRGRWRLEEEVDGINVSRTWIYAASGRNIFKRLASYWSFSVTALFGCFSGSRPDVLLVESPPLSLGLSGLLAARLRGARSILNVSDLWPASAKELGIVSSRPLLWLSGTLESFLYRRFDSISAVTPGIKEAIEAASGRDDVLFLPNGVDTELFHRVAARDSDAGVGADHNLFVYAGTLGYVSGLDVILEAARVLRDDESIRFLFVGDGSDKARLEALCRSLELDNVSFHPSRPVGSMSALLSASRASLVPLRKGSFFRRTLPAKLFPSLACGTPVIHCGDGDAARLIEEAGCGLVVPPESPELLAEAIRTLANDPALARRLGESGRRLVEQKYSWRSSVASWLAELGVE